MGRLWSDLGPIEMEKEKRKYFPEEEFLEMQGRKRREIFREGKHFGLWWEIRMEKEKRENLLETENITDHQTRIKFHQNLQIQRPGIPVDRWVPLSPPEGKIKRCIVHSFLHLFKSKLLTMEIINNISSNSPMCRSRRPRYWNHQWSWFQTALVDSPPKGCTSCTCMVSGSRFLRTPSPAIQQSGSYIADNDS